MNTIDDVFAHFASTGSAYDVVTAFKGGRFPLRRGEPRQRQLTRLGKDWLYAKES